MLEWFQSGMYYDTIHEVNRVRQCQVAEAQEIVYNANEPQSHKNSDYNK